MVGQFLDAKGLHQARVIVGRREQSHALICCDPVCPRQNEQHRKQQQRSGQEPVRDDMRSGSIHRFSDTFIFFFSASSFIKILSPSLILFLSNPRSTTLLPRVVHKAGDEENRVRRKEITL